MCCGVSIGALPLEGGGGGPYEEWRFSVLSLLSASRNCI